jgi:hypothetical protein
LRRVGLAISSLAVEIPFESLHEAKMMASNLEYHAQKLKELIAETEKAGKEEKA